MVPINKWSTQTISVEDGASRLAKIRVEGHRLSFQYFTRRAFMDCPKRLELCRVKACSGKAICFVVSNRRPLEQATYP